MTLIQCILIVPFVLFAIGMVRVSLNGKCGPR